MKHIKKIFAVLTMLFAAQAFAQPDTGPGYSLLSPPQPTHSGKKIEVLEFFFYGCIHCFHLHPKLSEWERKMPKDVQLDFVPTIFNPNWEPMANTYYALKMMGQQKKLQDGLYNAWNNDNMILTETDKIADFVAQHGVDRQKFIGLYNSFSVQSEVTRSKQMTLQYHISGTPTLVVDGRYVISGLLPDDAIRVLNEVIDKVRKEHGRN
ncbi:MAG TPA: thiol:disulfide interchange protein DsbA/DsbL [Gallionellaceae bacterium]|nr:thiol:disulfide interchange protein DsbA/DsbL [Gallionellaceae bacterium]